MGIVDEVKKVEGEVSAVATDVKVELEKLFGKDGVDGFLKAAENLLKTEAGSIIKIAVQSAKAAVPNGAGAVLHGIASAFAVPALKAAGVSVGSQLLNLAIETILGSATVL